MKKLLVTLGIAALSTGAMAQTWTFTYEGSGYGSVIPDQDYLHNNPSIATGTISGDILDSNRVGITDGFLSVTQGTVQGNFLLTGSYNTSGQNSLPTSGNRINYNNLFYPNFSPELDAKGLIFENNEYFVNIGHGYLWSNGGKDFGWFMSFLRKQDQTFVTSDVYGTMTWAKNPTNNAVPEPSEWAAMGLLGAGLLGLVVRGRKKNLAN
jgi:hypothetical protein